MSNLSQQKRCRICGGTLKFLHLESSVCERFECRQKDRSLTHRKRIDERHARLLAKAKSERDQKLGENAEESKTDWLPIITPSNTRKLRRLPRRRKHRFVKRLKTLLEEIEQDSLLDNVTPEQAMVADSEPAFVPSACSNCRGSCCRPGGTSAFIDERVVKRFTIAHPGISLDSMLQVYARYLPENSYWKSCVFHTETGCALPRQLRSNTCNVTVCGGVVELRNRIQIDKQTKFFVASTQGERVIRSRFVELKDESVE